MAITQDRPISLATAAKSILSVYLDKIDSFNRSANRYFNQLSSMSQSRWQILGFRKTGLGAWWLGADGCNTVSSSEMESWMLGYGLVRSITSGKLHVGCQGKKRNVSTVYRQLSISLLTESYYLSTTLRMDSNPNLIRASFSKKMFRDPDIWGFAPASDETGFGLTILTLQPNGSFLIRRTECTIFLLKMHRSLTAQHHRLLKRIWR